MAKRNPWAAVIGTTVLAGGALLGRKLKKDKEKKKGVAPVADAEVINEEDPVQMPATPSERKCPSCGNVDTSGARNCPLCFANMDPDAEFIDEI